MTTAVVLLNHGAADSRQGVGTFLQNIFRDREIIRLPGGSGVQRRFARFIAKRRAPKVALLYGYMGGGSPLIGYISAQAMQLESALGAGFTVHLGLRYYAPYISDALADVVAAGVDRVVTFPQYPQYSVTTVGSVRNEFDAAVESVPGALDLEIATVEPFGAHPAYIELVGERIRSMAQRCADEPTLLFSAHSIPAKFVDAGDPYPVEVERQAELLATAAGFDAWEVAYQSRSGPVRWLEPELVDHVDELLAAGRRHFLVAPISFVQDHLETLVELDVQLAERVRSAGGTVVRVRPPNATEAFAEFSADLVRGALAETIS